MRQVRGRLTEDGDAFDQAQQLLFAGLHAILEFMAWKELVAVHVGVVVSLLGRASLLRGNGAYEVNIGQSSVSLGQLLQGLLATVFAEIHVPDVGLE